MQHGAFEEVHKLPSVSAWAIMRPTCKPIKTEVGFSSFHEGFPESQMVVLRSNLPGRCKDEEVYANGDCFFTRPLR